MEARPAPGRTEQDHFEVTIQQQEHYRFAIDFGLPGIAPLITDEPAPLGEGAGPGPSRILAAALGNCLAVSLLFCLERAHIQTTGMAVTVRGTTARNEAGRVRIPRVEVHLEPRVAEADRSRMQRCVDVFEDYCTVSASVRGGIDVAVQVTPVAG